MPYQESHIGLPLDRRAPATDCPLGRASCRRHEGSAHLPRFQEKVLHERCPSRCQVAALTIANLGVTESKRCAVAVLSKARSAAWVGSRDRPFCSPGIGRPVVARGYEVDSTGYLPIIKRQGTSSWGSAKQSRQIIRWLAICTQSCQMVGAGVWSTSTSGPETIVVGCSIRKPVHGDFVLFPHAMDLQRCHGPDRNDHDRTGISCLRSRNPVHGQHSRAPDSAAWIHRGHLRCQQGTPSSTSSPLHNHIARVRLHRHDHCDRLARSDADTPRNHSHRGVTPRTQRRSAANLKCDRVEHLSNGVGDGSPLIANRCKGSARYLRTRARPAKISGSPA